MIPSLTRVGEALSLDAECECHGGARKVKFIGREDHAASPNQPGIRDYGKWRAEHTGQDHNRQVFRPVGHEDKPRMRFMCTCGAAFVGEAGATSGPFFFNWCQEHGWGARLGGDKKGHRIQGEVC